MDKKLKDILTNLNPEVDQEKLMAYLEGQLQGEQKHEVERQLASNDFESDAMDGLQEMADKRRISTMVDQLNRDLKKKTEQKKKRRQKLELPNQNWLWISALILLLLIVFSYIILHKMRNP